MAKKAAATQAEPVPKQTHISVQRYFEVSLLVMLSAAFFTVATTGKLDLISVVVVTVALLARFWSYLREADYSLSPRTVTRISIFYIFFYGLDLFIFAPGPEWIDRMLQATVHLVLFTTVVKVFSARTYRDYGYLATLSFLMMLASAVLTVGTTYLALFIIYVLSAISTFISYEIKRSMEGSARPPEGPFPTSAQNRSAIEQALLRTAMGLAAGIVVLASVLFFVIPRYRTGYLTSLASQAQNITGFSGKVDLGDIRKIKRSPQVVMRVLVEGSPRQFQDVKWRGVGLTSFDGKQWFNDNTEQTPLQPVTFPRFLLPKADGWQNRPRRPLHYRVLLSAVSTDVLFVAAEPREVTARIRLINLDQTGSLHNPQHYSAPIGYDVVSETGLPSTQGLRRATSEYPLDIRLLYLRLPRLVDPRVAELARQVTATATNNYDRAEALQSYFRNNFGYTLDPQGIDPADPIGSFLFKAKAGYCEYFAAAMAVMLRTLGIPSRLVNGFQTGSYNRIGKDFVVRARDAHSWVEAYFPEYGWISFDPTPADPNPVLPGAWDDYLDAAGLFWSEWIINYDFSHQVQLARQVEQDSRQFQEVFRRRADRLKRQGIRLAYRIEGSLMSHKILVLLLMMAILGGLIFAEKGGSLAELRFLVAWKFARRDLPLSPHEATLTYDRFLKAVRKRGFRKTPSQTPQEFALSFQGTRIAPGVLEFTRLYNLLRFGQVSVSLTRLRNLLREIAGRN